MIFHTFGDRGQKVLVMIHGMLSPWQIWEDAIKFFSKDYYVVVPELDGHTENETSEFISIAAEAEQIRQYLMECCGGNIFGLLGISLGGRIAATLVQMPDIHAKYVVIDGAPMKKMPGFLVSYITSVYKVLIKKTRQRDPRILERCKKEFLPERYLDEFFKVADHMEEQSVKNILRSAFDEFDFRPCDETTRILFMHGTKGNETVAAKSAKRMKKTNPQTEIRVFTGYAHAELASFETQKWIEEVAEWIHRGEES